jgi:hypothetical protein
VLFFAGDDGAIYLGSATVKGTVAQLSGPVPAGTPAGTYPIVALYLGNGTYLASLSNVSYVTVQ